MAKKVLSSNPNFQPKTYLVAVSYEEQPSGEMLPGGNKEFDITRMMEDNNIFFGAHDVKALINVQEGGIPETMFVISPSEYNKVKAQIKTILEGAIVNQKQLDAVILMVDRAFSQEEEQLWHRCRVR